MGEGGEIGGDRILAGGRPTGFGIRMRGDRVWRPWERHSIVKRVEDSLQRVYWDAFLFKYGK